MNTRTHITDKQRHTHTDTHRHTRTQGCECLRTYRSVFEDFNAQCMAKERALLVPQRPTAGDKAIAKQVQERAVRELEVLVVVALLCVEHAPHTLHVRDDHASLL